MARYEIKGKNKGKSEELGIVARKATCCLEDSDMLVMQGGQWLCQMQNAE